MNASTKRLNAPVCLTWQITSACNLKCDHCLAGGGRQNTDEELGINEIFRFIDDIAEMRVFYVNIGGGEPLLHPRFFDIVDYTMKKGVYVQFSTNGTLVDQSTARQIADRGLRVQVSLDGWLPEINDPLRGQGSFYRAVEALELLRKVNVTVSVNCVVTKHAVSGLDEMLKLAGYYGAGLRLSRLRPAGRAREKWRGMTPDPGQYIHLYNWLLEHPGVTTGDSFFFLSALGRSLPGLSYCGAGSLTCAVDPCGYVYPCPFITDKDMCTGNIREHPLSVLWREYKAHPLFEFLPAGCVSCPAGSRCRGGCRVASYIAYGNMNMPDPECIRGEYVERG